MEDVQSLIYEECFDSSYCSSEVGGHDISVSRSIECLHSIPSVSIPSKSEEVFSAKSVVLSDTNPDDIFTRFLNDAGTDRNC